MKYSVLRVLSVVAIGFPLVVWLSPPWYALFSMAAIINLLFGAAFPPRD